MRWDAAIDLGTANVRLALRGEGTVIDASSALAFRDGRDTPVYVGNAALMLEGRAGEGMTVEFPLKDGVLESNRLALAIFSCLYRQVDLDRRRHRFNVLITCAPFARPVQQEAMLDAALEAGAGMAALVRSDLACAVGAGLDVLAPAGRLLVDVGAGKLSATLFTKGRTAAFAHLPYGMGRIDERIVRGVRVSSGFRIGRQAAVEIKHTLGSALPASAPKDVIMHMTGFDAAASLPGIFDVETAPVLEACEDVVRELTGMCATVADNAPEELAADLTDCGAVLCGGGAEMTGLDKRVGDALGIPCRAADLPAACGIRGLSAIMDGPEGYEDTFMLRKSGSGWR